MSAYNCCCSSPDCRVNGCAQYRRAISPMGHGHASQIMQPHGCVCPAGAEKTCQGIACPRRNPFAPGPSISGYQGPG